MLRTKQRLAPLADFVARLEECGNIESQLSEADFVSLSSLPDLFINRDKCECAAVVLLVLQLFDD